LGTRPSGWVEYDCLGDVVLEQPQAVTEEHGQDVELKPVHQPALRYCWATLAPPPTATSFSPAAARACSRADSMPPVTKVNVVPPTLVTGSRAWWVRMNTG
jgi:hypothetical protein